MAHFVDVAGEVTTYINLSNSSQVPQELGDVEKDEDKYDLWDDTKSAEEESNNPFEQFVYVDLVRDGIGISMRP